MDRLTNIYNYFKADKGTVVDIVGNHGHHFGEFYEPFFRKFLNTRINLLEIGIQCGPSIMAHNEYFNHNVELYGIDIDYSMYRFNSDNFENIHLICGDSTSQEVIDQIKDIKFDIIIDDSSHIHDEMVKNLYNFHKLVSPDGLYIIEDVHCDYNIEFYNTHNESLVHNLLSHTPFQILTSDQNNELYKSIRKIHLYNYINNPNNPEGVRYYPIDNTSITIIIEFEKYEINV